MNRSEIRKDWMTGDWMIIAPNRAERPLPHHKPPSKKTEDKTCSFCVGNEDQTPSEVWADRDNTAPDSPGWRVRVFPNMFPALEMTGGQFRTSKQRTAESLDGYGRHEVIVETPEHTVHPAIMSTDQLKRVLIAYRERYSEISEDNRIRYVQIFKNYGEFAGSSMEHSHSQLIASPVIPSAVERELSISTTHHQSSGTLLIEEILDAERADGRRIIHEGERFTVLFPFAPRYPYEMHVLQQERVHLGQEDEKGLAELSKVLKKTLNTLYKLLENPPYNIFVHTAPCDGGHHEHFRWHLHIVPRLIGVGGFEIGTGIGINPTSPEETAHEFRRAFSEKDRS